MNLTDKQYDILVYIKKYIADNEKSPTIREIQKYFNLKSPSTIHGHIRELEKKGAISINHNKSRSINLLVENEYRINNTYTVSIPIIDNIYYGNYYKDYMAIPTSFFKYKDYSSLCIYIKDNIFYFIDKNIKSDFEEYIYFDGNELVIAKDNNDSMIGAVVGVFIKK